MRLIIDNRSSKVIIRKSNQTVCKYFKVRRNLFTPQQLQTIANEHGISKAAKFHQIPKFHLVIRFSQFSRLLIFHFIFAYYILTSLITKTFTNIADRIAAMN